MRIESTRSSGSHLILDRPIIGSQGGVTGQQRKTMGEMPPIVLDLKDLPQHLARVFGPTGLIERLRRRLNHLKRKKCTVVPAKGTTACVDDKDVVYLGVDFLEGHLTDEETLAGIMAHEWGHACALRPGQDNLQSLNWNQIFELRRAHETLADEISGRLLCLMGYKTDGLVDFLTKGRDTHNLKYHHPEVRAQVIRYGFEAEKRKKKLAQQLFKGGKNDYDSILLDIA